MLKQLVAFFKSFMSWFQKPEQPNILPNDSTSSIDRKRKAYDREMKKYNVSLLFLERFCKRFNYDPMKAEQHEKKVKAMRKATGRHFVRHLVPAV